MTTKIQRWYMENEPECDMLYFKAWWGNNVFIRDRIVTLFNSEEAEVIGTHYSKSITCPVIKTVYKGVEIIWQYNFYDWQIMIKSNKDLILTDLDYIGADADYFFYQGIPKEYQFAPYSKDNKKQLNQELKIFKDIKLINQNIKLQLMKKKRLFKICLPSRLKRRRKAHIFLRLPHTLKKI